jgi:hypothetical protein
VQISGAIANHTQSLEGFFIGLPGKDIYNLLAQMGENRFL